MSDGLSMSHLREDLWGAYVIAKREFWSNIKSIRSVVMVLILALIMVGGAMGFTQPSSSSDRDESYLYHVVAGDPDGRMDDLVVYLYYTDTLEPIHGRSVVLLQEDMFNPDYRNVSDDDGLFVAKNLTPAFHFLKVDLKNGDGGGFTTGMGVEYRPDALDATPIFIAPNLTIDPTTLSLVVVVADLDSDEVMDDMVVHVVGPNATIASGATVSVDGEANATNRLGICTFEGLSKGNHTVTATLDGSASGLTIVKVSRERTEVDPFALASADPDMVIAIIASIAMGIFGPIYAIVLCFDSVFREKLTGHIDYLLSRPMGRRAVISGKFLGILAALMVPITVVSLVGIAIINAESPTSASLSVVAGFLVYSTLLIAFFALLQMIFSTLAKTTGTAVLSGVGIWLMFSMLFSIIMVVVAILKGMELGSSEFNEWYTRVSLINPIDVYSHAISVAAGNNMGAGLPNWLPGTILVVLALVMLVLTSEVFRRRVTE